MNIEDLNLTDPLPDEGPWRVREIAGKPVAVSKISGAYTVEDGKLVRSWISSILPPEYWEEPIDGSYCC